MNRPQDNHDNNFIGRTSIGYMCDPLAPTEKLFSFDDIETAIGAPCFFSSDALFAVFNGGAVHSFAYAGTDVSLTMFSKDQFRYVSRNAPSLELFDCDCEDADEYDCDCEPDDDMDYYATYANIALLQHLVTQVPRHRNTIMALSAMQEKRFADWVDSQTMQQEAA